jgi:hypothetical protein
VLLSKREGDDIGIGLVAICFIIARLKAQSRALILGVFDARFVGMTSEEFPLETVFIAQAFNSQRTS